MATTSEKIQAELQKCNYTLWEPNNIYDVQLNLCYLQCLSGTVQQLSSSVTEIATAITTIEDLITTNTDAPDVTISLKKNIQGGYVFNCSPDLTSKLHISYNPNSVFFKDYALPALAQQIATDTSSPLITDQKILLNHIEKSPRDIIMSTKQGLTDLVAAIQAKIDNLSEDDGD